MPHFIAAGHHNQNCGIFFFAKAQFYNLSNHSIYIICISQKEGNNGLHKLYIELVFLDNFMVNMLIMLAAKITHLRFKWKRIVSAASIGGFYACAVLLLGAASATLPLKTMAALVMCFWVITDAVKNGFYHHVRVLGCVVLAGRCHICRSDQLRRAGI